MEGDMWVRTTVLATALAALGALAIPAGQATAQVVQVDTGTQLTATSPVTIGSPTLQADQITAQQVRAHAIYANRIDADRVHGVIYQTGGVTMNRAGSLGNINAPQVNASVIYADEIRANDVIADAVYVRTLSPR